MTAIESSETARILAEFETAANAAQVAEAELRRKLAEELRRSEYNRIYAFRRLRLIKTLAESAASLSNDPDENWATQRSAIISDLNWSTMSESYATILEHLRPLATIVRASLLHGSKSAPTDVMHTLEQFEVWFEQTHRKAFYALYDQYVPEVPVVDF